MAAALHGSRYYVILPSRVNTKVLRLVAYANVLRAISSFNLLYWKYYLVRIKRYFVFLWQHGLFSGATDSLSSGLRMNFMLRLETSLNGYNSHCTARFQHYLLFFVEPSDGP